MLREFHRLPPQRSLLVLPTLTQPARRLLCTGRIRAATRSTTGGRHRRRDSGERDLPRWRVRLADPRDAGAAGSVHARQPGRLGYTGGTTAPPPGYELHPPNSTEDVLLFTELTRVIAEACYPPANAAPAVAAEGGLVARANDMAARLRDRSPPFFDTNGNRLGGAGEYVVVVWPQVEEGNAGPQARPLATMEVVAPCRRTPLGTRPHGANRPAPPARRDCHGEASADESGRPDSRAARVRTAGTASFWAYFEGLAPVTIVWLALVGWLAGLLYSRANWSEQADRATVREWLDEARNFRKTLPELIREYARLREDDPTATDRPREKRRRDRRANARPGRADSRYLNQLPSFPIIYQIEVLFLDAPAARRNERIVWDSPLPRPRQETHSPIRVLEYHPLGADDPRALIHCEYQLHAFNKLQRREERTASHLAHGRCRAHRRDALGGAVRHPLPAPRTATRSAATDDASGGRNTASANCSKSACGNSRPSGPRRNSTANCWNSNSKPLSWRSRAARRRSRHWN